MPLLSRTQAAASSTEEALPGSVTSKYNGNIKKERPALFQASGLSRANADSLMHYVGRASGACSSV